jgi:glutamate synthase (NADPH/NADH) small chain
MAEYLPPKNQEEFEANFAPVKPLMDANQAFYESSRCLFCYDAPCVQACPTGIDIPLFIKQIHSSNLDGAAKTIFDSNVLGYACGKVCPTEVLCEGSCVYNHQAVPPIQIGRLQSYASGHAIRTGRVFAKPPAPAPAGLRAAIIGAGPAGLAAACELRMAGFEVDIMEARMKPSGLTVHGVAPYKITNPEVLEETGWLQKQFGFRIQYGCSVQTEEHIRELERDYAAIFLGPGLGKTRQTGIPGEELPGVWGAVEFVEVLREKHSELSVPARVVVLGGGNTAMDAASEAARMGAAQVTLIYRRPREEMGAYAFEYDMVRSAGVQSMFQVAPAAILGSSQVTGIRLVRTERHNGSLRPVQGSEFELETDWVILATGQSRQTGLLKAISGLQLGPDGCILVREGSFQTHNPRYFAAGDAVSGGQEVVNAVAEGKQAGREMAAYLQSFTN